MLKKRMAMGILAGLLACKMCIRDRDAGDYFGVYVYNKNDELVMTYYVHPNLWDAYSVTVDGEVKMLCSNDAVG